MSLNYKEDLIVLQKEFSKVNVKDMAAVTKWFADHPHLTTNDHARVANRSLYWIRCLKRKANIKGVMPKNLPISKATKAIDTVIVPENWKDKEWLTNALKYHSCLSLIRSIGISRAMFYKTLHKLEIPLPGCRNVIKNPCFSYEWCYEHYVTQNLSQQKCADLAGICVQNFSIWLNKLQIPVRGKNEKSKDVKIWVRELLVRLRALESVKRVELRSNIIKIKFKNSNSEKYAIDKVMSNRFRLYKKDCRIKTIPQTVFQYETNVDGSEYYAAHIHIPKRTFKKASFIERRLALQEFATVISKREYIHPRYPIDIITHDYRRMYDEVAINACIKRNMFTAYPLVDGKNARPGFKLIAHFFGLQSMWESILKDPRKVIKILNRICQSNVEVNTNNVMKATFRVFRNYVPDRVKIYDPRMYIKLLRSLNVTSVLDLHPGYGYRAMACAVMGIKYYTIPTPKFNIAIDNGLAEFIRLDYHVYNGESVDCVLSDNDLTDSSIQYTMEFASKAKRMFQFVKRDSKADTLLKFKPEKIIEIETSIFRSNPDYFFLF